MVALSAAALCERSVGPSVCLCKSSLESSLDIFCYCAAFHQPFFEVWMPWVPLLQRALLSQGLCCKPALAASTCWICRRTTSLKVALISSALSPHLCTALSCIYGRHIWKTEARHKAGSMCTGEVRPQVQLDYTFKTGFSCVICSLPASYGYLPHLQELYLRDNHLTVSHILSSRQS